MAPPTQGAEWDAKFQERCCKNRKHTMDCLRGLGDNSTLLINGSLIFIKENITIHGYNFTYKRNVSPFAYVYVTKNGEEALISYNKHRGNIRGSFDLNDGRSFAFHQCIFFSKERKGQQIKKLFTTGKLDWKWDYVFYQFDQNYLSKI